MGLLLSTISSGLLFGARDGPARYFAMGYAFVYVCLRLVDLPDLGLYVYADGLSCEDRQQSWSMVMCCISVA